MLPLCRDQGVAVLPWSPLARGRLTRDWDDDTDRSRSDATARRRYQDSSSGEIVAAVASIAEQRAIPRAQVALAWLLAVPGVTAPIVGATKPHHLEDAVSALAVHLTPGETELLESAYRPQAIAGH